MPTERINGRAGRYGDFWSKVDMLRHDGCWVWFGSRDPDGYGRLVLNGHKKAHRYAYAETYGPIPKHLEIDHLCGNPSCVRPDHLEPVTHAVNMRRRYEPQTHCSHGHEFTAENTYVRPSTGHRACRACGNAAAREYQRRRRARLAAAA